MRRMGVFLLFAMIALADSGCAFLLHSSCENTIKLEVKSPDGKYVATLFERNCGATTDFSTIVNLRELSMKFDADNSGVFVVKGQPKIDLTWDSHTSLRLQCQHCRVDDIFKQERTWKDVNISLSHSEP